MQQILDEYKIHIQVLGVVALLMGFYFQNLLKIWRFLRQYTMLWMNKKKPIEAYMSLVDAPSIYGFKDFVFLSNLSSHDKLVIVARTAFKWFVDTIDESTKKERMSPKRKELIIQALTKGAKLHFILQDMRQSLPIDETERKKLNVHQEQAIESIESILNDIDDKKKKNLSYEYIGMPITNSLTQHYYDDNIKYLIYNLGIDFEEKSVVIVNDSELAERILKTMNIEKAKKWNKAEYFLDKGSSTVRNIVSKYDGHKKRNNSPALLLPYLEKWFQYENKHTNYPVSTIPPPICVQISLTNNCVNTCVMCGHHNIKGNEMHFADVKRVLNMVADLGTNSVIFSGGEPLTHTKIEEILKYATSKNLKVGLMTSGLAKAGEAVSDDFAKILVNHCAWIQVSIDSFEDQTYRHIRLFRPKEFRSSQVESHEANLYINNVEAFNASSKFLVNALTTVDRVAGQGYSDLDICYTIQKYNVQEVIDGKVFEDIKCKVREKVKVRFKPVHGKVPEKPQIDFVPYLPSEEEFQNAVASIEKNELHQSKDGYLLSMIENKYFTYSDLAKGLPTLTKMEEFHDNNYKCHAIKQTLFIATNGDVFPCCHLYDDNVENSDYRDKHCLGSLKINGIIPDISNNTHNNTLAKIWSGDELNIKRNKILPVEPDACGKCTRHIRYNDIANQINKEYSNCLSKGINLSYQNNKPWEPPKEGIWV